MYIVVSSGHWNTENITANKIGGPSAARLRTATGAGGREKFWTIEWGRELALFLRKLGVDASHVDCIYGPQYGHDAQLIISGHMDGIGGSGNPQWAMGAAVHSGDSTAAALQVAEMFIDLWNTRYKDIADISIDGPVTDNMTYYYQGWYKRPDVPMVILEHGILYDAEGLRADAPTPYEAALADAMVIQEYFNLQGQLTLQVVDMEQPCITVPETGYPVCHGFRHYWQANGGARIFGFPLTNEYTDVCEDGKRRTVQMFERARFEYYPEHAGTMYEVQLARLGAQILDIAKAVPSTDDKEPAEQ